MPTKRTNPTELEVSTDHASSMRDEAIECLEQAASKFEDLAQRLRIKVREIKELI